MLFSDILQAEDRFCWLVLGGGEMLFSDIFKQKTVSVGWC